MGFFHWRIYLVNIIMDALRIYGASGEESTCQCRRHKKCGFDPWVGKTPWIGNGTPLQYSCLKSAMERRAWWDTVHGAAESDTTEWLSTTIYFNFISSYFMFHFGWFLEVNTPDSKVHKQELSSNPGREGWLAEVIPERPQASALVGLGTRGMVPGAASPSCTCSG